MRWNVHSSGKLSSDTKCVCGKNFQVRGETELKHLRTFPQFIKTFLNIYLNFLNPELFIHKKLFLEKSYFYFCFAGYDTEYTEADSKDIQNLAQEIETKYTQYGISKDIFIIFTVDALHK